MNTVKEFVAEFTHQVTRAVSNLIYDIAPRRHARVLLSGIQFDRFSGFPPKHAGMTSP
jgi:hypothetical protein